MLGSSAAYRALLEEDPGAFFLSRGWIICGITPMDEFRQLSERYGAARARRVHQQMFRHYERLVYVDTKGEGTIPDMRTKPMRSPNIWDWPIRK